MIHVLRLLLIVSLCIAFAPMRGGAMAPAQSGCASQAARVDICVAPGTSTTPALPQIKSCLSCVLDPVASHTPPRPRELAMKQESALAIPKDQTFGTGQWRPPRA